MTVPIGFTNTLRGGTFGAGGIQFVFEPSVGITAKKAYALERSIRSMREPLEMSVREVMRPSIKTNFEVGGRPSWDSLSESTIKRKGNDRILIETGKLARVAAQRNIWTIGRSTAIIDGGALLSRAPYALYNQAGTSKEITIKTKNERGKTIYGLGEGGVPPRPFLLIQEEDKNKIRAIFLKWIDMRIAKAWSR